MVNVSDVRAGTRIECGFEHRVQYHGAKGIGSAALAVSPIERAKPSAPDQKSHIERPYGAKTVGWMQLEEQLALIFVDLSLVAVFSSLVRACG